METYITIYIERERIPDDVHLVEFGRRRAPEMPASCFSSSENCLCSMGPELRNPCVKNTSRMRIKCHE